MSHRHFTASATVAMVTPLGEPTRPYFCSHVFDHLSRTPTASYKRRGVLCTHDDIFIRGHSSRMFGTCLLYTCVFFEHFCRQVHYDQSERNFIQEKKHASGSVCSLSFLRLITSATTAWVKQPKPSDTMWYRLNTKHYINGVRSASRDNGKPLEPVYRNIIGAHHHSKRRNRSTSHTRVPRFRVSPSKNQFGIQDSRNFSLHTILRRMCARVRFSFTTPARK